MKRYITSGRKLPNLSYGTLAETGERCIMQSNGYWVGEGGRRITSYQRVDKPDYNSNGDKVFRQYSMDRQHRFYVETEDKWEYYMNDFEYLEDSPV